MNAIPINMLLSMNYMGRSGISKISRIFDGYNFTLILALILGQTFIGKKFRGCLVHILKEKLEGIRHLFLLEYIPFLFSLAILVVFKIAQQQPWSDLLFAISYIFLTILFFFSFCWAAALAEISRNRKKTDNK